MRSIKDNRHVTQLPPEGFYPDPRVPTQERRWDGERWTIETRPLPVSPSVSLPVIAVEQPSLGSGYARLASALQAVMFVYAGVAMVSAGFVLWQRSVFLSWRDDPNRVDHRARGLVGDRRLVHPDLEPLSPLPDGPGSLASRTRQTGDRRRRHTLRHRLVVGDGALVWR